jgi:UDP-N-acetylglucosamine:LPS N-acetylglucosamine transferase
MGKKILIPYLMAGLGHYTQAQAIAWYLRQMRPDWDVRLFEPARELPDAAMQRTFIDLWRTVLALPAFVQKALFAVERLMPRAARAANRTRFRAAVPKAAAFLAREAPDLVVSTHWACTNLFAMARGEHRFPLFYVYGELEETYSIAECGADRYFTLSRKVSEDLARMGVNPAAIQQVPVIVDPAMVNNGTPRDVLRRGLGIPSGHLAVMLSLGGEGIGRTIPLIRAFARDARGATLIVLTGRNHSLLQKVRRRVASPLVIPVGYQDDISGIVASVDVLAGKSGTGFVSMAMATGRPLIITHLGAPNEAGNMRHVVANGHGWYCPRPAAFVEKVNELAGERGSQRAAASSRSAAPGCLKPPNGADDIARAVVEALA